MLSDLLKKQMFTPTWVAIVATLAIIVLFLFAAFFSWVSVQTCLSTWDVVPEGGAWDSDWTRWSAVFTGIAFMLVAEVCLFAAVGVASFTFVISTEREFLTEAQKEAWRLERWNEVETVADDRREMLAAREAAHA